MIITSQVFGHYILCNYKALLKISGKAGQISDYEGFQTQKEADFKPRAISVLVQKYGANKVIASKSLAGLVPHGDSVIVGFQANYKDMMVEIDALEVRQENLFSLSPIMFTYKNKIGKQERLLAAFVTYVLAKALRKPITNAKFVHGEPPRFSKVSFEKHRTKVRSLLSEIRSLSEKENAPRLHLNENCSICEFRTQCEKEALERDDLSLLRGMRHKQIQAQNKKGIFTVTQYSYTFRPRRGKTTESVSAGRYHALQALAIREKKVFIHQSPEIPSAKTRLYMDIETDPDRDFVYLIGLVAEDENGEHTYSLWADSQKQASLIIEEFLTIVKELDDYLIFHYGGLEAKFFAKLEKSYAGEYRPALPPVAKTVNILSLIFRNLYFPVYQNTLKAIAGYLGFHWTEPDLSGMGSVSLRDRWERSQEETFKMRLLRYNIEDCYALQKVAKYLWQICALDDDESKEKRLPEVRLIEKVDRHEGRVFKKNDFIIKEFEHINRRAYFDYQRDKVILRTHAAVDGHRKRASRQKTRKLRVNKVIELKGNRGCPHCGCDKLNSHGHYSRLVIDLLFLPRHAGAKRWIVKYLLHSYRCRECGRVFRVKISQRLIEGKYGWNLLAWVTYQNVVNGLSFLKIQKNLEDTFELGVPRTTLHRFKSLAASYHRSSYQGLLNRIVQSPVIHVDETQFKLKSEVGYVWVLTNVDDVVFAYQSSREGRFIWELLEHFDGVLVSDFYGVYDSLRCAQQKCLIHLIRDLNTDLYKSPLDKELRDICEQFGFLLRECVDTIDKYGLKRRYLQKHRKTVERFYKRVIDRRFSSDLAIQYQKRLHKNRDRLFTFLEHDGVPWNNNNVEHAIKHLAAYRRMTNGILTQKGLEEYLILLSLYQSCTYRGQNFLDFLLSAKRRID